MVHDSVLYRYGHVCALVGSVVYLFGGTSGTSYMNDLYLVDCELVDGHVTVTVCHVTVQ